MQNEQDNVQRPDNCCHIIYENHKYDVQKALDELQACVVLAGGSKPSIQKLANMTLAEAMFAYFPNNISIRAFLTSFANVKITYTKGD